MSNDKLKRILLKVFPALVVLGSTAMGVYAVLAPSLLGQFWVIIVALLGFLIVLPWVTRSPTTWLFACLVLCLSFSARLRFGTSDLHPGGAEAAIGLIDFPLIALFILYLLEDLKAGKLVFYNGPVERRLLLFAFVGSLSVFGAASPSFVFYEIIRLFRTIVLIYCTRRFVRDTRRVNLVLYLLVFNIISQSVLGLTQLALGRSLGLFILGEADSLWFDPSVTGTVSRVGGTLGHANALAMFLEMQLPIILSLSIARDVAIGNRDRILFLFAFVLGGVTLAMTFSRSGWLSLAVATGLVFFFHFRGLKLTIRQLVLGGSAGIVAMAALVLLKDPILRRLGASSSASFTIRSHLIVLSQNMIKQHPWLGIGLNNFTLVMSEYNTFDLRRLTPVHNLFFLTAAETGIVGLIVFLWLLVGVFSEGWKILKTKIPFLASLTVGILAGLIAALVHSNLGWLWRYDVVYVQFWFLVGYMLSLKNLFDRPYSDGVAA